ncbi:DUF222 domain-containing protein [Gordonia sp. 852002-50395_SCH5434458]|uniref:DUF222 domain-containing protein n=1 Tax=Gordonia sp. 852002-50395_SCH5434458 TaxID=1834090 RepID=UPI000ACEEDF5|nr:DUF222 domain-containing protein [Gordonia sp. 852002-50395_SCH5434458]
MNSNSKRSNSGTSGAPSALVSAAVGSADAVVAEKLSRLAAVLDELATVDVSLVSDDVLVEATVEAERLALRTSGAVTDRLIVEASDRDLPHGLGFRDIRNFMGQRLHIGDPAARYRVIAATGSFTTICGDRLPPSCPTLAGYVVEGRVAGAHVRAVLEVLEAIPADISAETKAAAEAQIAGYAVQFTPAEITNLGSRLLAHLDPDGTLTNPKDRKRRRRLWVNRQNAQLMSRLTADLDPIARARLDTVLDAWAKPGMNNPDDPDSPVGPITTANAEQVAAAALRDQRSPAQRNHDAFSALLGQVLESGMLGHTHRGLPIQVIVTTSLHELEAQAGIAQTTSGTLLPIQDVIEMAATSGASQYVAVFGDHTSVPLYLGRSKRIASLGQRFASFASCRFRGSVSLRGSPTCRFSPSCQCLIPTNLSESSARSLSRKEIDAQSLARLPLMDRSAGCTERTRSRGLWSCPRCILRRCGVSTGHGLAADIRGGRCDRLAPTAWSLGTHRAGTRRR